jgi:hypothetical protein
MHALRNGHPKWPPEMATPKVAAHAPHQNDRPYVRPCAGRGVNCRARIARASASAARYSSHRVSAFRGPLGRGEVVSDVVSLDVPNESAAIGRQLEAFENIDIKRELNGIVKLRFAVAIVGAAFLGSAGLDVAGHMAAQFFAQEIRHAEQVVGTDAAAVDQGIASERGSRRSRPSRSSGSRSRSGAA